MTLSSHQRPHHGAKDEWLTPPEIIAAVGPFDLDPCAPIERPWDMATRHFTIDDDGLALPWDGFVWCNPPFGAEAEKWLTKLAEHGNGIGLCPARTETRWFRGNALGVWRFERCADAGKPWTRRTPMPDDQRAGDRRG